MWFVQADLLLARKAFSTAAQVAYTVHMVFNIKTVCLHFVILEMPSFPMSAAKHFYDNPLSIYLDPKNCPNLSSAPCRVTVTEKIETEMRDDNRIRKHKGVRNIIQGVLLGHPLHTISYTPADRSPSKKETHRWTVLYRITRQLLHRLRTASFESCCVHLH